MTNELSFLLITAAAVGFLHTILGPDHYVPFIAMSRAGNWTKFKTTWVTMLCGLGHVGSTITLGFVGIAFGYTVFHLEVIESYRGDIAGWLLIIFGVVYTGWGIRRAFLNRPHAHKHIHHDGIMEVHAHDHHGTHDHNETQSTMRLWILFTIFVFGPCEPLIPMLMYPAARGNLTNVVIVCIAFSIVTIGTMLGIVFSALYGLSFVPMKRMEQYSHALGGFAILLCGIAVQFLGL
ncbi:MAG: sulfite exporter TauE/SafE family protein [Bacteroidetes bacterium]|nr:sulfite exporter TauE/SafE family protein [Bacteroidota bacterium]